MITTSYFAKSSKLPNAVAISRWPPKWYQGRRYEPLAPPVWLMKADISDEEAVVAYRERVLAHLDPYEVVQDVGPNAVLLCFERPGEYCHRRVVAKWLHEQLGIVVRELDYAGKDYIPGESAPASVLPYVPPWEKKRKIGPDQQTLF